MTKIEVRCPACDTKTVLTPDTIALWDTDGAHAYAFVCLTCADVTVRSVDARGAALLTTAGVAWWDAPRCTPSHPEAPGDGPAFTRDDLLAFHELLATDDAAWFGALAQQH